MKGGNKLDTYSKEIRELIKRGLPMNYIARRFDVTVGTFLYWRRTRGLKINQAKRNKIPRG